MQVPGFILTHTNIKESQMWHFYMLLTGWAAIYTVMNVSVVLFLQEVLGSIFLAGLALSVGSLVSLVFDGLFSSFQKNCQARRLFLFAITGMIIAVGFFIIAIHPVMAFLAAIFFRVSFDLCDITATSYILARCLPAEYGQNLSYKQLAQGIGMIFGFIISAIILAAAYFVGNTAATLVDSAAGLINLHAQSDSFISTLFLVKLFLLLLLFTLFFLTYLLFDRDIETFSKRELYTSFQKLEADTVRELKQTATKIVRNIPGKAKMSANTIELRSTEIKSENEWSAKSFFSDLTGAVSDMVLIFQKKPCRISLIWSMAIMGLFSYWDTFLGTFLPIFFTEVLRTQDGWIQNLPGSLIMLFFILPILALLPMAARWGDKYGRHYFMTLGIFLTAIATFLIGVIALDSMIIFLLGGFGIAFGYLFGMSSAKAEAAARINEFLAVEKKTEKIDSNASAGPIMLVDNIGNIIGPVLGGAMISIFGFPGFFILFSLFLMVFLAWTIKNYDRISGYMYVFQSPLKLIKKQDEKTV